MIFEMTVMKPILIDALYINSGGGLSILRRLLDSLKDEGVDYVLIRDQRCPELVSENSAREVFVMPPSLKERHKYYNEHKNEFHSILCFGNVPPTVKMPCKVHTYFHNLSVLKTPDTYSTKRKVLFAFKRYIIKLLSRNTDTWIVQTSNTENMVKAYMGNQHKSFYIFPIYHLPKISIESDGSSRNEYLFIGDYTFSKGHDVLLRAWEKLHEMGESFILNLTVDRRPATEAFCEKLESAINQGVPIINHGVVPFERVCDLYARSKAIVYPSLLESLGLGIVEGISAGCDVIISDLPFAHSICKPSETFDPFSEDSIVEAVMRYEKGNSPRSILTIYDCSAELIGLLKS